MDDGGLKGLGAGQPDHLAKSLGRLLLQFRQSVENRLAEDGQDRRDALRQAEAWQEVVSFEVAGGKSHRLTNIPDERRLLGRLQRLQNNTNQYTISNT